jgi:hypothetical protein
MAHECPDCGQTCFCNGDIDDCENNFEEDVINCTHCLLGKEDDEPEDVFDWAEHELVTPENKE